MTLKFDGEWAQKLEKWYCSPDVIAQREFVLQSIKCKTGEHVLDIGVGPGFLSADLAVQVGSTGLVHGIDISQGMLDVASSRCDLFPWVSLELGDACSLKHPKEGLFDCIVSTQVYEYVSDIDIALTEAFNILKPGGRLIILDTDFDSVVWNSSDRDRMRKILVAYDEHLVHPHLPPILRSKLEKVGFEMRKMDVFTMANVDLKEDSYSYGLLSTNEKFVVGRQGITSEEVEAWKKDQESLDSQHQYFFSLNRYLFVAYKPL